MNRLDDTGDCDLDDFVGRALRLYDDIPVVKIAGSADATEADEWNDDRIAQVRGHLDLLLDDQWDSFEPDTFEPPADLTARTRNRIRHYEAVQEEFREQFVTYPRWRIADFAVAAAVLVAVFVGSIPWLDQGRMAESNLACAANLSQIWRALELYSDNFGVYPNAAVHDKRLPVGAALSLLRHFGYLHDSVSLTCPGCSSQVHAGELTQWNQLREETDRHLNDFIGKLTDVYAIHPGLKSDGRLLHLERATIHSFRASVPILGDKPPIDSRSRVLSGNSPYHGGYGQNVIFADGHRIFLRSRSYRHRDSDIYSNRHGQCGPAVDPFDSILVPASRTFFED